jgi:hypothetical protein
MKPAHPKPGVLRDSLFDMRMRRVQILVLAVLFRLFKPGPLGYHVVNTTLLR